MSNIFQKWLGLGETSKKSSISDSAGVLSENEAAMLRWLGIDPISVNVSAASAMSISTFYSCVRLISDLIAAQPFSVQKKLKEGGSESMGDHKLHYLLHTRPNKRMSPFIFKRTMFLNMLVYGFSIAEIVKNGFGEVVEIIPYMSSKVEIKEHPETGDYYFAIENRDGQVYKILSEDEVIFLKDLGFNGNCGHSIVKWQATTIKLDLLAKKYGEQYYEKNALLNGIVTTDLDPKNAEAAKIFKDRLLDNIRNDRSGIAILSNNAKYQAVGNGPVESQIIEFLNQSDKDILKAFGLPAAVVGDTEKATSFGTGIESLFIQVTRTVIIPKAIQLEEEVNYKCLTTKEIQKGYYTKFNFKNLLRGDAKTEAEYNRTMIQNGVYSPNEVRAWSEMSPIEGGDQHWIQQNMMPIDKAEEILTAKSNGKGITVPAGQQSQD